MPSHTLTPEQRQVVLAAVWNALRARDPTLFEQGRLKQPGGIATLDENLDVLIEMAREMTADRIEPYLARIIDDICGHCEQQEPSGYCPLRRADKCVLFGQARLILETIDSVLHDLKDREFIAARGGAAGS